MKVLAWDTDFFGVRIARNDGGELVASAVAAAREQEIECLYLFLDAGDLDGIRAAVLAGARPVEVRTELDLSLTSPPDNQAGIRRAGGGDEALLVARATELSAQSRFRADPRFAAERVSEMYAVWVRRCLDEGAVVVPEDGGGLVGARSVDGVAHADLVYVAPGARGAGVGRALLLGALAELDATMARTTTRLANLPAQRLFQSTGFRTASATVVLHLWLDEGS